MRTGLKRTVLGASVVAMGWPVAAGQTLTARVITEAGYDRSDVVIQAFIEPDTRNRSVSFELDSGTFYTSSRAELAGDRGPRSKQVVFKRVPAGAYNVYVTLLGTDGTRDRLIERIELW